MLKCDVTLRLGGSLLHTVKKENLTPAEIVVLQKIHGEDAVVDIIPDKMDSRSHAEELERLCTTYDRRLVENLFPGHKPKLPVTLEEAGIDEALINKSAPQKTGEEIFEEDPDDPVFKTGEFLINNKIGA